MIHPELIFRDQYMTDDLVCDTFQDLCDEYENLIIDSSYFIQYPKNASLVYHNNFNKLCIGPFFKEKKDPYLVKFHRIQFTLEEYDLFSDPELYIKHLEDKLKFINDIKFCLVRLPKYKIQTCVNQGQVIKITLSSEIQEVESEVVNQLYELTKEIKMEKSYLKPFDIDGIGIFNGTKIIENSLTQHNID